MSNTFQTADQHFASFLSYAHPFAFAAIEKNAKGSGHFFVFVEPEGVSFLELKQIFHSEEGALIGNGKQLLESASILRRDLAEFRRRN